MRRSTLPARLITAAIALIATPIAVTLLTTGGNSWLIAFYRSTGASTVSESLIGPSLLQLLAIALLAGVVLTGIWSSAGLLAAGALSIVPITLAIAPMLLPTIYTAIPGEVTRQVLDSITYGVPQCVLPVLGAMGTVLAMIRRGRWAPGRLGLAALGLVLAPIALLLGGVLLSWGHGAGMLKALREFRFDLDPLALVAVLAGVALIVTGILLTRWSAFALLLPAGVLLALSAFVAVPGSARWFFLPEARELSQTVPALLLLGTGVMTAVIFFVYTVVLLVVRRRARALPSTAGAATPYPPLGAGTAPDASQPPAPYPPAPYPPAPPAA